MIAAWSNDNKAGSVRTGGSSETIGGASTNWSPAKRGVKSGCSTGMSTICVTPVSLIVLIAASDNTAGLRLPNMLRITPKTERRVVFAFIWYSFKLPFLAGLVSNQLENCLINH